jgi:opacity protein-like surface antigen
MKGKLFILVALAAFAIPAVGSAAPPRMGPYVSGFIGISLPQDTDVNSSSGIITDRVEFDPGINVGASGGFDFGYVRLEGELSYKHSEIAAVNDQTTSPVTQFRNIDGSLGVFAAMFNGFFDLHNDTPVTPYLGGGIGFATLHLSDTFGTPRGGGTRTLLYDSDDDTVFAYQAGAGLEIALNRMLSLDLGYRYFATSRANFEDTLDQTDLKYESHNGTVGIRVKF